MQVVKKIVELKSLIRTAKMAGKTIGLVPTMGYFHEGHLTLMRRARAEQDFVIATLFVNPLQFGPNEDYAVYPRNFERDSLLAASTEIDVLFAPEVSEMYPAESGGSLTSVNVDKITETLCGASRPGHFRGVATVVTKLLNLSEADVAYFGQKDAQQVTVIRRMVDDLNMNVQIVSVPIVREADGLAMSSRNQYLTESERKAALVLSQALQSAATLLASGNREASAISDCIQNHIRQQPLADLEYVAIVDGDTLLPVQIIAANTLVALAAKFGNTRLIDNLLWEGR